MLAFRVRVVNVDDKIFMMIGPLHPNSYDNIKPWFTRRSLCNTQYVINIRDSRSTYTKENRKKKAVLPGLADIKVCLKYD